MAQPNITVQHDYVTRLHLIHVSLSVQHSILVSSLCSGLKPCFASLFVFHFNESHPSPTTTSLSM